jgi:hypothetical protein
MRAFLLFAFCFLFGLAQGQQLDISFGAGTGKSYIIESVSKTTNARYGLPGSFFSKLKFSPRKSSKWGTVLMFQQVTSTVSGSDVVTSIPLSGYVNSFSTSLLLEYENATKKSISYGCNFGIGLTNESIRPQRTNPTSNIQNTYPSLSTSLFYAYRLSNDFDFMLSPMLLWHDPSKSFSYLFGKGGNLAGEDISVFLHLGIRYHIFK